MLSLLFACAILLASLPQSYSAVYPHIVADTFVNIKNSPAERFVLFYYSSSADSTSQLTVLNEAARRIKKFKPSFLIQHCDGDLPVNRDEFSAATFNKGGSWWFTSTPVEGIMKYTGPQTASAITRHIRHKYLPFDASDTLQFQDEDDFYQQLDADIDSPLSPSPSPIFVKFFEKWCEHCKRLAPTFITAATVFKPTGVRFLEIECSLTEATREFCQRNAVSGYPALILFTGEDKVKFEEEMRSVDAFDRFFVKHVANYQSINRKSKKDKSSTESDLASSKSKDEPVKAQPRPAKASASSGKSADASTKPSAADVSTKSSVVASNDINVRLSTIEQQISSMQSSLQQIMDKLDMVINAKQSSGSRHSSTKEL